MDKDHFVYHTEYYGNQDELNAFHAKGNNKVYLLHSSIILQKTNEKNPFLFCRKSRLIGKMDA